MFRTLIGNPPNFLTFSGEYGQSDDRPIHGRHRLNPMAANYSRGWSICAGDKRAPCYSTRSFGHGRPPAKMSKPKCFPEMQARQIKKPGGPKARVPASFSSTTLKRDATGILNGDLMDLSHPTLIVVRAFHSYSPSPPTAKPLGPSPVEDGVPAILAK